MFDILSSRVYNINMLKRRAAQRGPKSIREMRMKDLDLDIMLMGLEMLVEGLRGQLDRGQMRTGAQLRHAALKAMEASESATAFAKEVLVGSVAADRESEEESK